MRRPEPDSPAARQRAAAAADWLVKHDRGLTAAEQDAFLQWLASDARHGEWLALHRRVVDDFNCLAQWRPEHSAEPNPDLLARPLPRWRRFAPIALAAAAVVAIASVWWQPMPRDAGDGINDLADTGDFTRRILEDGSAIELNRGAAVRVAFTATERRVLLERGEALFTVARQPARPFVVNAAGVDVHALGTVFNVRLASTAVEVLVAEGRVRVAHASKDAAPPVASEASRSEPGVRSLDPEITAGQRVTVALDRSAPPHVVPVTAEESARLLAWQPQLLDFSSAPLARALEEFNRRNRVQFVLADAGLAALPIVASIRSDNVAGFARILATTPGLAVEPRGDDTIVIRRNE